MSLETFKNKPYVKLRLQSFMDFGYSDGKLLLRSSFGISPVMVCEKEFYQLVTHLHQGIVREALHDKALKIDGDIAIKLLMFLNNLFKVGFLLLDFEHKDKHLFTMSFGGAPDKLTLTEVAATEQRALSRFAFLRRHEKYGFCVERPLSRVRYFALAPEYKAALMELSEGVELAEIYQRFSGDDLTIMKHWLSLLEQQGFLVSLNEDSSLPDRFNEGDIASAQWDFHDLLFHCNSRLGDNTDDFGGNFPWIGKIPPLPAVRKPWPGTPIPLSKPDIEKDVAQDKPMSWVQLSRASIRYYDDSNPITLEELGHFLYRTARVQRTDTLEVSNFKGDKTPMEITRRPYPTGGASYEHEIYFSVDKCQGLERGMYYYAPEQHAIYLVRDYDKVVGEVFQRAFQATGMQAQAQIVITIAARFQRVNWKYQGLAYSVILKNTGVLYQTMYLVATSMELAPCGIGSGDNQLFAKATGLDPLVEGAVGEFLLGRPGKPPALAK